MIDRVIVSVPVGGVRPELGNIDNAGQIAKVEASIADNQRSYDFRIYPLLIY